MQVETTDPGGGYEVAGQQRQGVHIEEKIHRAVDDGACEDAGLDCLGVKEFQPFPSRKRSDRRFGGGSVAIRW